MASHKQGLVMCLAQPKLGHEAVAFVCKHLWLEELQTLIYFHIDTSMVITSDFSKLLLVAVTLSMTPQLLIYGSLNHFFFAWLHIQCSPLWCVLLLFMMIIHPMLINLFLPCLTILPELLYLCPKCQLQKPSNNLSSRLVHSRTLCLMLC
jgi:hypothetical protein